MELLWRIRLLGELWAEGAGRVVTRFQTQKTAALLAYLAFYPEQAHPRDLLVEVLWPEEDPHAARHRLRMALTSLRRQLEPPGIPAGGVIRADRQAVRLNASVVTTDVAAFQATIESAQRSRSPTERARSLAESVELYRGELLPGFHDDWVLHERQRLAEAYFQALTHLIQQWEQSGDLPRALEYARRAVSADPLREEFQRDLMRLLAAAGQPSAALQQYHQLERLLRERLDTTPSTRTRLLVRDIQRLAEAGGSSLRSSGSGLRAPGSGLEERMNHGDTESTENDSRSVSPCLSLRALRVSVVDSLPPTWSPEPGAAFPLPAGTVTFLLAEIEGAHSAPAVNGIASAEEGDCADWDAEVRRHGGHIAQRAPGSVLAVFARASDALACLTAMQQAPYAARLRGALHTGEVEIEAGEYRGTALDQTVALLLAAQNGQCLCSEATAVLLRSEQEPGKRGVLLADLGRYYLRRGTRLRVAGSDTAVPARLFQMVSPDRAHRELVPPKAPPILSAHLPLQLTRFFGREREIAQLCEILGITKHGDTEARRERHRENKPENSESLPPCLRASVFQSSPSYEPPRLVTLTGPGGTGKTRLALEVASRVAQRQRRAVCFVPLQELSDPRMILHRILDATGMPRSPQGTIHEQLVAILAQQPALLILDNFEQLLPAGAAEILGLLEQVPDLAVLVTSRRRLGLTGERVFPVPPLPTPAAWDDPAKPAVLLAISRCPAVQLFVDRAQAVRPDFQVTRNNADAVAALCARLEGLPLALELAAAWIGALTPAQMLARLEQRFEWLIRRHPEGPRRHFSLRAALEWSCDLLSPELRWLFPRLCIFRGGWTLPAAEAICSEGEDSGGAGHPPAESVASDPRHPPPGPPVPRGEILTHLEQLRDASLLLTEVWDIGDEAGAETRYHLLETVREYATERLSPAEWSLLRRRHAVYYLGLAEEAEPQLTGPAQVAWMNRLEAEHDNLRAALSWALEAGEAELGLRLGGALWWFWNVRGHYTEARRWLAALLALPPAARTAVRAKALNRAGSLALHQDDQETARTLLEEALSIRQELGRRIGLTGPLNNLGHIAMARRDYEGARRLFEQCVAIYREHGDRWGVAMALANVGYAAYFQGDLAATRACHAESLAMMREVGDLFGMAYALRWLGNVALEEGDIPGARSLISESLELWHQVGAKMGTSGCLTGLGQVAAAQGLMRRAARLLGAGQALRERLGAELWPVEQAALEQTRAALGEQAFAAALEEGRSMALEQAVIDALGAANPKGAEVDETEQEVAHSPD